MGLSDFTTNGTINAQHVLVNALYHQKNVQIGFCLPSVCKMNELMLFLLHLLPQMGLQYSKTLVQVIIARTTSEQMQWGPWEIYTFWFLIVSVGLVLIGTLCDATTCRLSCWKAFSLNKNLKELFESKRRNDLGCLDGIKVMSYLQIVFGHTINSLMPPGRYNNDNLAYRLYFFASNSLHVAVDSFLLISGLLLSYQFMRARQRG